MFVYLFFLYLRRADCERIGGSKKEMETGLKERRLDDNKIGDDRIDFSSGLPKSFSRFQHFSSTATRCFFFYIHHYYMSRAFFIKNRFFFYVLREYDALFVFIFKFLEKRYSKILEKDN